MEMFICNNCGFRFQSKEQKKCPYCNDNATEQEKSAEELVDSITFE